jgi:hypothetical protein
VADNDRTGQVFSEHIAGLRDLEFDRMKTLEGRGALILRTDLALLTAAAAIATFTIGRSMPLHVAPITAFVTLIAVGTFVLSVIFAARVQAGTSEYMLTSDSTLDLMVGEKWNVSDGEAGQIAAIRDVEFVKSVRPENQVRANQLKRALRSQIAFVLLLVLAGSVEVCDRLGAVKNLCMLMTG